MAADKSLVIHHSTPRPTPSTTPPTFSSPSTTLRTSLIIRRHYSRTLHHLEVLISARPPFKRFTGEKVSQTAAHKALTRNFVAIKLSS